LPLPLVTPLTREKISRDLDDRGPDSCMAETLQELRETNPELLDIATKCGASFGERSRQVMLELCVFYRLLRAEYNALHPHQRLLSPFPRVTPQIRHRVVEQIDDQGLDAFTMRVIEDLERHNAELLQMAHNFATRSADYLPLMQAFSLVYTALSQQAADDSVPRSAVH
jgi:hypothetical protein